MCTIITVLNQKETIFIHNRDRPIEGFYGHDLRIIDKKIVGIYDFRSKGIACGINLNTGIYGGVANVLGYIGKKSRGILLLNALSYGKELKDVIGFMIDEIKTGNYSSANYLIGNRERIFVIENFSDNYNIYEVRDKVVITNHFKELKQGYINEEDIKRKKYVEEILNIEDEEAILKIPLIHKPIPICRHGKTLSSFIAILNDKGYEIFYKLGYPCEGYLKVPL